MSEEHGNDIIVIKGFQGAHPPEGDLYQDLADFLYQRYGFTISHIRYVPSILDHDFVKNMEKVYPRAGIFTGQKGKTQDLEFLSDNEEFGYVTEHQDRLVKNRR